MSIAKEEKPRMSVSAFSRNYGYSYDWMLKLVKCGELPALHEGRSYTLDVKRTKEILEQRERTQTDERFAAAEKSPRERVGHFDFMSALASL